MLWRYVLSGVGAAAINLIIYQISLLYVSYWIANLIAMIGSKLFSYVTSKVYVFKTETKTLRSFLCEFARFFVSRSITAIVDYFGLIIAVSLWDADPIISKYVIAVLVVVLNYFMSKKHVFKM